MSTKKTAAKEHFAKTEAHNAATEAAQAPAPAQPAAQPQQVLCLVVTPQETNTIFNALGELPAKVSEGLRSKIKNQAEQQPTLLKGLYAEASVQEILTNAA